MAAAESSAAWEDWVGRETRHKAYLDPAQANRMAATLDKPTAFAEGDGLPLAWHWLFFHDTVPASKLGVDGHPRLGVTMPQVPLPRRMWAGGRLRFLEPLPLGATAHKVSRIASITPKTGRSGDLFFVSVDSEIVVEGRTALEEQQTVVYRELVGSGTDTPPTAPKDADFSDAREVDSTTLFRYSALTFNGHRIHYDVDYARQVEGYDNLVVHGPLIATLLLDSATGSGYDVETFSYRAKSPLLLPETFTTNGRIGAHEGTLWAATPHGRLLMEADVRARRISH